MDRLLVLYFLIGISVNGIYSQNRIIKGRVISDQLETMPGVSINLNDTTEVGKTDLDGNFELEIPFSEKRLLFGSVGLYPARIDLEHKCEIEVIMILSGSRESISLRRADRQLKKRFKMLPKLHKMAFEKGIFKTEKACYNRKFQTFYLKEN